MKIGVAAFFAALLAVALPQTRALAQAPAPVQPYIQIPVPGILGIGPERRDEGRHYAEHCERLREGEHEIRDRLAYAPPYSEERERLEHRLWEVREERERCRGG